VGLAALQQTFSTGSSTEIGSVFERGLRVVGCGRGSTKPKPGRRKREVMTYRTALRLTALSTLLLLWPAHLAYDWWRNQ